MVAVPSRIWCVLANLCPKCRQGKVFRGFYTLNSECSHCGLKFEREAGYSIGSVVIHYVIAGIIAIVTMALMFLHFKVESALLVFWVGIAELVGFHPILNRLCKLTWFHIHGAIIDQGYE